MALHFRSSNALLLLVPKTGSTWIRATVARLGLDVEAVGDPAMRDHDLLGSYERSRYRVVGAFVRDPVEWYRSYWAYRMERGWRPRYPLDRECRSDDFATFVRNAVTTLPGALGNIYRSYVGGPGEEIDFVGRHERLVEDFARFLEIVGEPVDATRLASTGRVNATSTRPDYAGELKELVALSEWETMRRFGYLRGHGDPIGLADMQERYPADADDHRMLALWTAQVHWAADDERRRAGRPVAAGTRHARVHGNFALVAQYKHQDLAYAERRYRRALELDPAHPRTLCNYALFVWRHQRDPARARALLLRALAARPLHAYTLGKLARFTDRALEDPALAEVLYRQSLALGAGQSDVPVELAGLLAASGRTGEAVRLLRPRADGEDATRLTLLAFAALLERSGHDPDAAWHYRRRAAEQAGAPDGAGGPAAPRPDLVPHQHRGGGVLHA